jgi:hypothetical protein
MSIEIIDKIVLPFYQAMLIMGGLVFKKGYRVAVFLYSFREGAKRVLHTTPGQLLVAVQMR